MDKNINLLTVIANESYEDFANILQKEIEEDCGVEFTGKVKDKRKRVSIKLKKGYELDQKFIDLWEKIKHRTKYQVNYSTDDLIKKAADVIKKMPPVTVPDVFSFLKLFHSEYRFGKHSGCPNLLSIQND